MKKIIIIILFSAIPNLAQFESWEYWDVMSKPVAGGDIWLDGEEVLYIFGGYSDSLQTYVDWIQKYRPLYTTSKIIDRMTAPRFGLVADSFDSLNIFFGGIQSESSSISGIEKWNTYFTDEAILNFDINFNRNFATGHIIEDKYYIIGGNPLAGTINEHLPYIFEYNLTDSKISYKYDSLFIDDDLPEQQMSEVLGQDIYIFGGVINGISQDIYKFNILEKTLEKLEIQLLQPRAGGRAVADELNNKIYLIGGYNEDNKALNEVEIFSVFGEGNYYIEKSAPINEARYHFMSAKVFEYIYIMGGLDEDGKVVSSIERFNFNSATTDFEQLQNNNIHNRFELYQNYPNPFNPATTIKYSIPSQSVIANGVKQSQEIPKQALPTGRQVRDDYASITLSIYDVLGNKVKTLVDETKHPGNYMVSFNGAKLSSGVYFYQLSINDGIKNIYIQTRKMILAK